MKKPHKFQQFSNLVLIFWRMPFYEKMGLAEATILLTFAKLVVTICPFRMVAPWLAEYRPQERRSWIPGGSSISPRRIGVWIEMAARHLPVECLCLAQAMAAKPMLRRRGLAARLNIGVRFDEQGTLYSHAWMQSDSAIVTGGSELYKDYKIITDFNADHLRALGFSTRKGARAENCVNNGPKSGK